MIKNIFITLALLYTLVNPVFAKIDVVYPTAKQTTISSNETFFTGNVEKNSKLFINSQPVTLWQGTFFVHMVPLKYGKNIIRLEQRKNKKIEKNTYVVYRPKPLEKKSTSSSTNKKFYSDNFDGKIIYSKTIKESATVREKPSLKGKRIIDLPKNVVLYLTSKQGAFYKISERGESEFWIHETNLQPPVEVTRRMNARLKSKVTYEDDLFYYHKFYISHPVLYTFDQKKNSLTLTLHGIDKDNKAVNYVESFDVEPFLFGFEGIYEDNNFILKIAKPPVPKNDFSPLHNVNIFVDAGHGGKEKGCIGADRTLEKDINLDIAKKLVYLLSLEGANVHTSRLNDSHVDLYDRVDMAKEKNALISVSIHSNSLPYGKNPYKKHGTEVHYFNENAKELSRIIQSNLVSDLGLKDGGVHYSSFALNRSTNPVSVLVEVAYMINPSEYILLKDEKFRINVAKSLVKSLKQYVSSTQN